MVLISSRKKRKRKTSFRFLGVGSVLSHVNIFSVLYFRSAGWWSNATSETSWRSHGLRPQRDRGWWERGRQGRREPAQPQNPSLAWWVCLRCLVQLCIKPGILISTTILYNHTQIPQKPHSCLEMEIQVAQVLLTLPYSFSQLGMLSGVIFQIFYGILGSWTAYLISVLYIEYRSRKEKENVSFKNHVIQVFKFRQQPYLTHQKFWKFKHLSIPVSSANRKKMSYQLFFSYLQWFEVLDGLLGPYWKAMGLAFNCTFLLFGSVIQLIACARSVSFSLRMVKIRNLGWWGGLIWGGDELVGCLQQYILHKWSTGQEDMDLHLRSLLCHNCLHSFIPQLQALVFSWSWYDHLHCLVFDHCSPGSRPGILHFFFLGFSLLTIILHWINESLSFYLL